MAKRIASSATTPAEEQTLLRDGKFCAKAQWETLNGKRIIRCTVFGPNAPLRLWTDGLCAKCRYHPDAVVQEKRWYVLDSIGEGLGELIASDSERPDEALSGWLADKRVDENLPAVKELMRTALIRAGQRGLPTDKILAIAEKRKLLE